MQKKPTTKIEKAQTAKTAEAPKSESVSETDLKELFASREAVSAAQAALTDAQAVARYVTMRIAQTYKLRETDRVHPNGAIERVATAKIP